MTVPFRYFCILNKSVSLPLTTRKSATDIPALVKFAIKIILNDVLYPRESVSITHDATKALSYSRARVTGKLPVKLDLHHQIRCLLDLYRAVLEQRKPGVQAAVFGLYSGFRSVVNQFGIDDFSGTILNIVHAAYPFYLISCFERFSDALG